MALQERHAFDSAPAACARAAAEAGDWIVVACADHVRRGVALGVIQAWHGGAEPLRRIVPASRVACYSPTESFRGRDPLQRFTAFGIVLDEGIFQVDLGNGFRPCRRRVRYVHACEAAIDVLCDDPDFGFSESEWDERLRLGLLRIGENSMDAITRAMLVNDGFR